MKKKKVIGLTLGDIGGVGPEVVLKTLFHLYPKIDFIPVIFGSAPILFRSELKEWSEKLPIKFIFGWNKLEVGNIYFYSVSDYSDLVLGRPDARNGRLSFDYIQAAVDAIKFGPVDALVTAPICKESLQLAGVKYTGHTTMLQHLTGSAHVNMAFFTPRLKTVLSTVHIPLSKVSETLDENVLSQAIRSAQKYGEMLGLKHPRIAVAGLNPHAGENGMFGREELDLIQPIVKSFKNAGLDISGPYPPDTLYFRAYNKDFDIVVSLYHDQGLIPIKLLGFHDAVNVTVGLPFVRTSPDHGTAFDIAYQGKASASSMIKSVKLALNLVSNVS